MKVKDIIGREILDSRGNPTIEVTLILENDKKGIACVPSGASTGSKEALELRDNDHRYHGKGVLKAVDNVNNIIKPVLIGQAFTQKELDQALIGLDGTENKSRLGANAILGVSLAFLKATAAANKKALYQEVGDGKTLPIALMNIINGGEHADNNLEFQEFMIVPQQETMAERIRVGSEIFHHLKKILKSNNYITSVGDEGGFAPNLEKNEQALDLICEAIKKAGYQAGTDVMLALDVAASEFYENGFYQIGEKQLTSADLVTLYQELVNKYPITIIEDGLDEKDYDGFKLMTEKLGDQIMIIGDDVFVTNSKILQKGIEDGLCNAILIKANQIGTYSEMLETIELAKANNYHTVISHRSGETEDTFIADFAVGLDLGYIKTGSLSRTDRVGKYNRLMQIEKEI